MKPSIPFRVLDTRAVGSVIAAKRCALTMLLITNDAAATRYVKIYDKLTAPTSADTPKLTIRVPASTTLPVAVPTTGVLFTLGLGVRCVTGRADNDNTDATANDVCTEGAFI